MRYLCRFLGDEAARACGQCDNCTGETLAPPPALQHAAEAFPFHPPLNLKSLFPAPIRYNTVSEAAMNTPNELRYTRSDEWIRIDGEIATIGITDYAQSELGDIVFLELPEPGRYLQVDESFGVIESVKAASDLYAPLEGEVIEVNTALQSALETINQDPYGKGWMIKLRMKDPSQAESLLTADEYRAYRQI
jgi:glycine cleavage system H protein